MDREKLMSSGWSVVCDTESRRGGRCQEVETNTGFFPFSFRKRTQRVVFYHFFFFQKKGNPPRRPSLWPSLFVCLSIDSSLVPIFFGPGSLDLANRGGPGRAAQKGLLFSRYRPSLFSCFYFVCLARESSVGRFGRRDEWKERGFRMRLIEFLFFFGLFLTRPTDRPTDRPSLARRTRFVLCRGYGPFLLFDCTTYDTRVASTPLRGPDHCAPGPFSRTVCQEL
jgi:hypothetical protein